MTEPRRGQKAKRKSPRERLWREGRGSLLPSAPFPAWLSRRVLFDLALFAPLSLCWKSGGTSDKGIGEKTSGKGSQEGKVAAEKCRKGGSCSSVAYLSSSRIVDDHLLDTILFFHHHHHSFCLSPSISRGFHRIAAALLFVVAEASLDR